MTDSSDFDTEPSAEAPLQDEEPFPEGTVAMLAAASLDGPLLRSLTAEFSRRGTVHAAETALFYTTSGPVHAVRWSLSLQDSDDDFGTQLISSLLEDAAEQLGGPDAVTTTVLPALQRPADPMMLIMDVDSTLIDQEVIDMLAARADREAEVADVTERAMRGELDFAASLHARVQALAGLDSAVLEETYRSLSPTAGAQELIRTFSTRQAPTFAVSGGFRQILDPLADDLGLTAADANTLDIDAGYLTGAITGEVVDRQLKAQRLKEWAEQYRIPAHHVVAVGDGANDLDMVATAGVGVAFCAKPALAEAADLVIKHRSLQLIGYALGISR